MPRTQPSSDVRSSSTTPAPPTVSVVLNSVAKLTMLPTPAWRPLPSATTVEQLPFGSGTTSVNGTVDGETPPSPPEHDTWSDGALNSIVGKLWLNRGVDCDVASKDDAV